MAMDERRARELLDELGRAVPGAVVLWRGPGLGGSDVDLLVLEGRDHTVARTLREAGLSPAIQDDGRILWRQLPRETVVHDAMPAWSWPPHSPLLGGLLDCASREDGLLVAS